MDPKITPLAFVADTQAPMWIEAVFLKSHNNIEATELICNDILRLLPPVLFILGDVVTLGHARRPWIFMNGFLKKFRENNIGVYAILGNHELMQRPLKGERVFQGYFPDHVRTGYVVIRESIAVLMLNSNFGNLSMDDIRLQQEWMNTTLEQLDKDPQISAIIMCCHHSPFTDSRLVSASKPVQDYFVPAYIKSKKARLFLSGHAHVFHHYRYEGKDFLVIGGGGGLRHPLNMTSKIHPDLSLDYKPIFHYLTVHTSENKLCAVSRALLPDFSGFVDGKILIC
jgi:hypothetical protein